MALSLNEVIELKKYIKEKYNEEVHFHDTCSGQYFTIDNINCREHINDYLKTIGKTAQFQNKLSFTIA